MKMQNEYTYYENKLYPDNKGISATHNNDGSITVSIVWQNVRKHRLYQGYTVEQAITSFCEWINYED